MTLWQGGLFVAAAAVAAAWLFRMKVRPPRIAVASLWLWAAVLDRPRDRSLWDRIRWFVSLAVTIAIASALAFAIARSASGGGGGAGGRVLLVLDSSVSMQARTSGGGTRWDRAVRGARLQAGRSAAVVIATTGDGLVEGPTSDLALVDAALQAIAPHGGDAGSWPGVTGVDAVHFFTDGAVRRRLDPSVIVHSVHEPVPNVAITAFGTRPSMSAVGAAEAYLDVENFSAASRQVHLTLTRGGAVLVDRDISLAAGESLRQILPIALAGDPRLHAHVSASGDALAADDDAVAWMADARSIAVHVVGRDVARLSSLLARDRGLAVAAIAPADYKPEAPDVFVFDRWLPPQAPVRPALCVLPPDAAWLGHRGDDERAPDWGSTAAHPVLAGADLLTLDLDSATGYVAPDATIVAASGRGTSLVAVRDRQDSRLVLLGFDPAASRVAASPALPVLVGNALEWLARPSLVEPGLPGPRDLPASTVSVTSPAGNRVPLVRAGGIVRARFDVPGLYLVQLGGARAVVTINVTAPEVSNLMATTRPASESPGTSSGLPGRPWWTRLVWVAVALLGAEWWTWQRRITV